MLRTPTHACAVSTCWPSLISGAQALRSPNCGAFSTLVAWQAKQTSLYTCSPLFGSACARHGNIPSTMIWTDPLMVRSRLPHIVLFRLKRVEPLEQPPAELGVAAYARGL